MVKFTYKYKCKVTNEATVVLIPVRDDVDWLVLIVEDIALANTGNIDGLRGVTERYATLLSS